MHVKPVHLLETVKTNSNLMREAAQQNVSIPTLRFTASGRASRKQWQCFPWHMHVRAGGRAGDWAGLFVCVCVFAFLCVRVAGFRKKMNSLNKMMQALVAASCATHSTRLGRNRGFHKSSGRDCAAFSFRTSTRLSTLPGEHISEAAFQDGGGQGAFLGLRAALTDWQMLPSQQQARDQQLLTNMSPQLQAEVSITLTLG